MKDIDIKKIIARLRRPRKKKRGAQNDWDAHRDWSITISLFLVLTVSTIFAHTYLFRGIGKEDLFSLKTQDDAKPKEIDEQKLEHILSTYRERTKVFDELFETESDIADPSL